MRIVLTNSLKIIAVLLSKNQGNKRAFMWATAGSNFRSWLPKYVKVTGTKNAHFRN
jgi:hypothetical protein